MIPLFKVLMSPNVGAEVQKTLYSGYVGQGEKVQEFEQLLSDTFDWDHVLTLNSCTSAIQLALHLVKSKENEPVLLPPLSCFATTSAVLSNGMTPRWVDIDPATCNMDLEDLRLKLTPETKIILLVHFAGLPINYYRLNYILDEFQSKHGFRPYVIEDCAQSLGSLSNGRYTGCSGNICCFSFQAVKLLTTGDGGAIVLPDEELYERAKLLRWYGLDRRENIRYQNIKESGFKYHMNDISATIGICNLNYIIEQNIDQQQATLNFSFRKEFNQVLELDSFSCGGQCPILVEKRDAFEKYMLECGVESTPCHYRCDLHDCVKEFRISLPGMNEVESKMTLLPCGWWLSNQQLKYVINCVKREEKVAWKKEGF